MRQIIGELAALGVGDEEEEVKDANTFLVDLRSQRIQAVRPSSAAIDSGDVDAIETGGGGGAATCRPTRPRRPKSIVPVTPCCVGTVRCWTMPY